MNKINKKLLTIALVSLIIVVVGFIGWAIGKSQSAPSQEFSGKIVCLSQINGQAVCAYGLQTSDSKAYALDSTPEAQDYNLAIRNYVPGSSVVVNGTLSTTPNQKYDNYTHDGIISATAIRGQ